MTHETIVLARLDSRLSLTLCGGERLKPGLYSVRGTPTPDGHELVERAFPVIDHAGREVARVEGWRIARAVLTRAGYVYPGVRVTLSDPRVYAEPEFAGPGRLVLVPPHENTRARRDGGRLTRGVVVAAGEPLGGRGGVYTRPGRVSARVERAARRDRWRARKELDDPSAEG